MNPHKVLPNLPRVATSAEWYAYYKANAKFQLEIPWERGAEITSVEIDAIANSLSIWQLGETSNGSHLVAAAKKYAQLTSDPQMIDVICLFIKEEQRHGSMLGQFLDLAQIPRIKSNWGDTIFRAIRYSITNIEIWSTPVIMVETIALIYYKAIQKATQSIVLYSICQQILRDEVKHIRFQYERFAILFRDRPFWLRMLTLLLHRMLYIGITLAVWIGHHRALQAGGYNFSSYWREAWVKMNFAWRRMKPERYEWKNCSFPTLPPDLDPQRLPQHIAVIMDGNGRWATRQGLPRIAGHRQGARVLKELLRCCKDWGIKALTAYAFSTENWRRPTEEVDFLMMLFERLLRKELVEMHREGVRISFVGDLSALPKSLQREIELSMVETLNNQAIHFTVAVNYGSRNEIVRTCRQIAQQVQTGEISPEDINESLFEQHLYTAGTPDPDLLIRTSGEMRLSNYLLWQLAYTELYFTDLFWPDFDRAAFHQALLDYQKRDRRFGKIAATVSA